MGIRRIGAPGHAEGLHTLEPSEFGSPAGA